MTHKNDLSFNAKFNGKQKFSFRKLSVGLAAAALGTTFFLSDSQLVHADVENAASSSEVKTEEVDSQSQSTADQNKDSEKVDENNQQKQTTDEKDSTVTDNHSAANKNNEATTTLEIAQHPKTINQKQLEESKINSNDVTIKTDDTDQDTVNNLKKIL